MASFVKAVDRSLRGKGDQGGAGSVLTVEGQHSAVFHPAPELWTLGLALAVSARLCKSHDINVTWTQFSSRNAMKPN